MGSLLQLPDDTLLAILDKIPPAELHRAYLLNKEWGEFMASSKVSEHFRRKLTLVFDIEPQPQDGFFLAYLTTLVDGTKTSENIYTCQSYFPEFNAPVSNFVGSCGQIVLVIDSRRTMFVINLRKCQHKMIWDTTLSMEAYALRKIYTSPYISEAAVVRVDPLTSCIKIFKLQSDLWRTGHIAYAKNGWSIRRITSDQGVFVYNMFAWFGAVDQGSTRFYAIITLDGATQLFNYIPLEGELLKGIGALRIALLDDKRVALWKPGSRSLSGHTTLKDASFQRYQSIYSQLQNSSSHCALLLTKITRKKPCCFWLMAGIWRCTMSKPETLLKSYLRSRTLQAPRRHVYNAGPSKRRGLSAYYSA